MRPLVWFLLLFTLWLFPAHHGSAKDALSDGQVRQRMIRESLAAYPGPCPCPYNVMRNGRACGGRSAYSRPGGYSPLCYPSDISDRMVEEYRRRHGLGR